VLDVSQDAWLVQMEIPAQFVIQQITTSFTPLVGSLTYASHLQNLCINTCPSGDEAENNVCSKLRVAAKKYSEILHMILPLTFSILFLII